ncbi:MAG: GNAT family N-acetyltransferase [Candidatus Hydrogenedentes bacterium]|nr:GNAT family N-acetyltransferase [Candidatus Hydrogenedentota bacterium]
MSFVTKTFLRRAERDDLDIILTWMEDPDFRFFLYGDEAQSPRHTREKIIMMLGRGAGQTMPPAVYLLMESKGEGPVGMISLQNISWRNRSCNLDVYMGSKQCRNSMLAAVSVYRALEYIFDELNLHRVNAFIYAFNRPSWRIFEKAGAVREMTLEKHILRDGKLYDAYGYGLLREEFEIVRKDHGQTAPGISLDAMVEALACEGDTAS